MAYRFRIRVDLADTCLINLDLEELQFTPAVGEVSIRLVPGDGEAVRLLKDARSIVLVGGDYETEQEAGRKDDCGSPDFVVS